MSAETHPFEQNPEATQVRVCVCGKWPDHHVHTGDRPLCGCNDCQAERLRAQQRREDLIPEVSVLPDDLARLIRSLPQPRDTDAVRLEAGVIAHTYLKALANRPRTPPRPFDPVGSLLGLPIVVKDELPPCAMRMISRAGDITHEWEMPVSVARGPGGVPLESPLLERRVWRDRFTRLRSRR